VKRLLRLLGDPTRVRILAAVEPGELAVNEIADVLGMSQSRISNHLRLLRDAGALRGRREGSWTFYSNALPDSPETAALWRAVAAGMAHDAQLRSDAKRRRAVLDRRRRRSHEHFAAGAADDSGQAEVFLEAGTLREEILAALAPAELSVVDAGCGDGFLTELLGERFRDVLGVDHVPRRIAVARGRVPATHVRFEEAELDALPVEAASRDAVFFSMVLHHVPEVAASLREAFRVLRPGGRVVVADLAPHDDESMRERMGDLRLGLDPERLVAAMEAAGFRSVRLLPVRDRLRVGRDRHFELILATGVRPQERSTPRAVSGRPRKPGQPGKTRKSRRTP